ncbi:MAG: hypothetical protein M5R40_14575 [Anaerolineae bacterium]|nr:hypothetical protein [Anaerolineae bacterium]
MGNDIDRIEQRVFRYWYEDGLAEIAAGCIFLLAGILLLIANAAFGPPDPAADLAGDAVPRGRPDCPGRLRRGRHLQRDQARQEPRHAPAHGLRRLPPRAGRVWERPLQSDDVLPDCLLPGAGGCAPALEAKLNSAPAFAGPLLGVILVYLGYRLGLRRFYALAAVSAAAGLGAALADLGDVLGIVAFFGVMGVALALSGTAVLFTYLNRHPTSGEGA